MAKSRVWKDVVVKELAHSVIKSVNKRKINLKGNSKGEEIFVEDI